MKIQTYVCSSTVLKTVAAASVATLLLNVADSSKAQAATFDNNGIVFDVDTLVQFNFVEAFGELQSVFGVVAIDAGSIGTKTVLIGENSPGYDTASDGSPLPNAPSTCGVTINTPCNTSFLFKSGQTYSLFLDNFTVSPQGESRLEYSEYSTSALNAGVSRITGPAVIFDGDLANSGTLLRWEDYGALGFAADFDDFLIQANKLGEFGEPPTASTPEPALWLGLGVLMLSAKFIRRYQQA
jgi:hypothetical protein